MGPQLLLRRCARPLSSPQAVQGQRRHGSSTMLGAARLRSARAAVAAAPPAGAAAVAPEAEAPEAPVPPEEEGSTRDGSATASTSSSRRTHNWPKIPKQPKVWPTSILPPTLPDLALFENGVLLVDKPKGWTSFDVCGKLRNVLRFLGPAVRKVRACVWGGGA